MSKRILLYSIISAVGLTLGASAALQAAGDHEGGHEHEQGENAHTHGFGFGEPAEGTEPDRIVEITALDSMKFDPSEIQVKKGETIQFVIRNDGSLYHSFTIGSRQWHREHEKHMQGVAPEELVSHMRDESNGTVVPPGESRSLTWKFSKSGVVPIGCHVPGHFPAGMKGEVEVESS